MKRITKRFLGCFGLVAVLAMTVVAYNLPSPAVATDTLTDTLSIRVYEQGQVEIISPERDAVLYNKDVEIITDYTSASELSFSITYEDQNGAKITKPLETLTCSDLQGSECAEGDVATGQYSFRINLDDYAGYGFYTVNVTLKDYKGDLVAEGLTYFNFEVEPIPVPNTGNVGAFSNIAALNLSNIDYILTGVIVFFSVAGFSTYLILRKRS